MEYRYIHTYIHTCSQTPLIEDWFILPCLQRKNTHTHTYIHTHRYADDVTPLIEDWLILPCLQRKNTHTHTYIHTYIHTYRYADDTTPLIEDWAIFPCLQLNAKLGVFDHVLCGTDGANALILDAAFIFYELDGRKNRTGRCDMVVVGGPFHPLGKIHVCMYGCVSVCM